MTSDRSEDRKGTQRDTGSLSPERRAIIRERIETRYYDRPEVVEVVARSVLADREYLR